MRGGKRHVKVNLHLASKQKKRKIKAKGQGGVLVIVGSTSGVASLEC